MSDKQGPREANPDGGDDAAPGTGSTVESSDGEMDASAPPSEDAVPLVAEAPSTLPETEEPAPAKRRWWLILLLIVVSVLAGAGGVGYWGWMQLEIIKKQIAKAETSVKSEVATMATVQASARASLITEVEERIARVDSSLQAVDSNVNTLSALVVETAQSDPGALVMAEIDYLLQLANHQISLEYDRDAALLALNRAQSRMASLEGDVYAPIVEQISTDKAALEAAPDPGIDAIVNSIAELLQSVDGLVSGQERIAPEGESPSAEERTTTGWEAFVSALTENLSQFVEVRRADGAATPTLIPDQDYFARENVRISLSNARNAAVRRDDSNYQLSLGEARHWLSGHFSLDALSAQHMLNEIDRLLSLDLTPRLPDVSASLVLLRRISKAPDTIESGESTGAAAGTHDEQAQADGEEVGQ